MDFLTYPYLVNEIVMAQRPVYPYLQMLRQHFGSGKIMSNFLEWQKTQQKELQEGVEQDLADEAVMMTEIYGDDWWGQGDPPVIQIFDSAFGGIKEMTGVYNLELWSLKNPMPPGGSGFLIF